MSVVAAARHPGWLPAGRGSGAELRRSVAGLLVRCSHSDSLLVSFARDNLEDDGVFTRFVDGGEHGLADVVPFVSI